MSGRGVLMMVRRPGDKTSVPRGGAAAERLRLLEEARRKTSTVAGTQGQATGPDSLAPAKKKDKTTPGRTPDEDRKGRGN